VPARRPEECPYPRPFAAGFDGCPAFKPDEFVPLDAFYQPLKPIWTCANLTLGADRLQRGRYFGRCRIGDYNARVRWAEEAEPARVDALRRLRREIFGLAAPYLKEIFEVKGEQLKAAAEGVDATAATARLKELAARNLADVHAYVAANEALLDEVGIPAQPLLELISYQLEDFVNGHATVPAPPPAEVMEQFPVGIRRLIAPDAATE
jgi:hypothetical protein